MSRFAAAIIAPIFFIALHALIPPFVNAQETDGKNFIIRWESIEGIIRYSVQIKDTDGALLVNKYVETNYIEFTLPPGTYQIRIGAINKFEKLSFWTGWQDIHIKEKKTYRLMSGDFPAKIGLAINAGLSYNMLLPPWSRMYKNADFSHNHINYLGAIGFHFGDSKLFKGENFLRFMGVELEGSFCEYDDRFKSTFKSKLMNITGGPNFFIKTRTGSVVNFYFRVGAGVNYSLQAFSKLNLYGIPYQRGTVKSIDPYVKTGVSMEISFLYALSLSVGADYFVTFYKDQYFQQLRYFAMLGVRI